MQAAFSDSGIILKTHKYKEADKIVTILSQHHGLIVFRAPGARRITSKKTGHLDTLNLIKFQVARSHPPQILTQAQTLKNFSHIKKDLNLAQIAFFCAEAINQLTPENQPDQPLFQSFNNLLDALNNNKNSGELLSNFLSFLLKHFGYPLPKTQDLHNLTTHIEQISSRHIKSKDI
jgi:DNA repair protein RecO (recombination protein O)